jgi:hypothetical protein
MKKKFILFILLNNYFFSIKNTGYFFLNVDQINEIEYTFKNKYILKKIIREYIPIILLSFIYLNIFTISILSILQILLCKDLYNLITCILFISYFFSGKLFVLYIFGFYLFITYLIEVISIIKYVNINVKILQIIGILLSLLIIGNLYNEKFQIKNILIINSFLVFTGFIHPFSIENRQKRVIKNNKFNIGSQDFYRYI